MECKIIFGPRKCTFQNDEFTLIYNLGCKVTSQANLDLVTQQFLFQRITFSYFIFYIFRLFNYFSQTTESLPNITRLF